MIVYLVTYDSHTLSFNALDMIFFDSLNIFKVPDLKIFKSNVWTFPEIISIDSIFPLIHGPHFPISLHVLRFFFWKLNILSSIMWQLWKRFLPDPFCSAFCFTDPEVYLFSDFPGLIL